MRVQCRKDKISRFIRENNRHSNELEEDRHDFKLNYINIYQEDSIISKIFQFLSTIREQLLEQDKMFDRINQRRALRDFQRQKKNQISRIYLNRRMSASIRWFEKDIYRDLNTDALWSHIRDMNENRRIRLCDSRSFVTNTWRHVEICHIFLAEDDLSRVQLHDIRQRIINHREKLRNLKVRTDRDRRRNQDLY